MTFKLYIYILLNIFNQRLYLPGNCYLNVQQNSISILGLLSHRSVCPDGDALCHLHADFCDIILLIMMVLFLPCLTMKTHYPFYTIVKHCHAIHYAHKCISLLQITFCNQVSCQHIFNTLHFSFVSRKTIYSKKHCNTIAN